MSEQKVLRHECPVLECEVPASLRNADGEKVRQMAWAALLKQAKGEALTEREGKIVAVIEACATLLHPGDYREPVYVVHPRSSHRDDLTEWVAYTLEHYHGAKPYRTFAGVGSQGYAAW